MKVVIFLAVLTVAKCASLTDLKALLGQQHTYTCTPTCGAGKCCVHFITPVHGGKRQLISQGHLLKNAGGITTMCKDIPKAGERCLMHNPGEWCDCATGLTCKPDTSTLTHLHFGKCE